MRPQPTSTMSGRTAWQQWNAPVRLTPSTRSHSSGVTLRNRVKVDPVPALLTRMAGGPSSWRTSLHRRPHVLRAPATSAATPMALPPSVPMTCAAAAAASPSTSRTATACPSLARRRLMASPIPDAAPVTIATRCSLMTGPAPSDAYWGSARQRPRIRVKRASTSSKRSPCVKRYSWSRSTACTIWSATALRRQHPCFGRSHLVARLRDRALHSGTRATSRRARASRR